MINTKEQINYWKQIIKSPDTPVWFEAVAHIEIEHLQRKIFVIPGKKI